MILGRNKTTAILSASGILLLAGGLLYWTWGDNANVSPPDLSIEYDLADVPGDPAEINIPGGIYLVGHESGPRDVRPARQVEISPFTIDRTEVTNAMFAEFIDATRYITDAERRGESLVFDLPTRQFTMRKGASWREPTGPGSSIVGKEDHPVVQVSWFDAQAYARWSGESLPTEFQWEAAARGKNLDQNYPWQDADSMSPRANLWEGEFPVRDLANDGFSSTSPVQSFPPSPGGLFDLAGNVAEWTSSWYAEDSYDRIDTKDPVGATSGEKRVTRGGSWISSDQTGTSEAMIWYRGKLPPEMSNNFTGFRCAGNR